MRKLCCISNNLLEEKMKNSRKLMIGSLAIFIVPLIIIIMAYPKLPEVIGTHFDFNGNVNGTMNKFIGTYGMLGFLFVVQCLMVFIVPKDPKYSNVGQAMRIFMFYSVPIITTVTLVTIIGVNLGYSVAMNQIVGVLLGGLFIGLGNYLPKTKRNYTVGIKIPWTLDDDDNWNKTHRLGGYCFIIAGLFMIIGSFINQLEICFILLFVLMFVPFVYSYMLYRKKLNK